MISGVSPSYLRGKTKLFAGCPKFFAGLAQNLAVFAGFSGKVRTNFLMFFNVLIKNRND